MIWLQCFSSYGGSYAQLRYRFVCAPPYSSKHKRGIVKNITWHYCAKVPYRHKAVRAIARFEWCDCTTGSAPSPAHYVVGLPTHRPYVRWV